MRDMSYADMRRQALVDVLDLILRGVDGIKHVVGVEGDSPSLQDRAVMVLKEGGREPIPLSSVSHIITTLLVSYVVASGFEEIMGEMTKKLEELVRRADEGSYD